MFFTYKKSAAYMTAAIIIAICFLSSLSYAQDFGRPLIKNFTSKDYHLVSPIWCVEQDERGLMYFGSEEGVLEYDGSTWRLIKVDNNSAIRSLCNADDGRIYVTGSSDFGYLAPDSIGQMAYHSLLNYMPKDSEKFGEVWDVISVPDGIYFKTQDKVFHWDRTKITTINSVNAYRLYAVEDEVYARDAGTGLLRISGDSASVIPDGETFSEIGVWDMLSFKDQILVTTAEDGLYLYDGQKFSRFKSAADTFLIEGLLYNTCRLSSGKLAFATRRNGVAILDRDGNGAHYLTKENGLVSNVICDVFQDTQGGLWIGTEDGISRVEITSPFSMLPPEKTANSRIAALYRFQGRLFAGIVLGAYYLDEAQKEFQPVSGTITFGNSFGAIGKTFFATDLDMIFSIDRNLKANKLFEMNNAFLFQSAIDSNVIYALDRTGLWMFRYKQGVLTQILETMPIDIELASLAEDGDGSLWIQTYNQGLYHVKSSAGTVFSSTNLEQITFNLYDKEMGVPGSRWPVHTIDGITRFATDVGLFRFDNASKTFVPDSLLGKDFADGTYSVEDLKKDRHGGLWIWAQTPEGHELGKAIKQDDGTFQWQTNPKFRRLDLNTVLTFYPEYDKIKNKDITWVSTDEGLFRYEPKDPILPPAQFGTFIRMVTANEDSLIFSGAAVSELEKPRVLTSEYNNLLFRFSAASYDKTEANEFQYRLDGYEKNWSPWTLETQKAYTNLSDGDYEFQVRSKNVYGVIGTEDSFPFKVLAPWYLTWYAFGIYGLLFLGILFQVRRWELKRVNKKHAMQLQLVEFDKLKKLDQLKSQFFANISHEFRTPLTLILGQLDSVQSPRLEKQDLNKMQVAYRNARRLLRLINELLDLSKLEAGGMELRAETHNLVPFLKNLVSSFESLAQQKDIELKLLTEADFLPVKFEPEKLEKVFYNLIFNALKFTQENGFVTVRVIQRQTHVNVIITDSGIGITSAELPHIFDRFYQVDGTQTREHEGSGIGLALAKELVELHGGEISVSSEENVGATFTIRLPVSETEERGPQNDSVMEHALSGDGIATKPHTPASGLPSPAENEIILIVEDNTDVRAYIREQLQDGYTIAEAEDGQKGLAKALELIPDLIITDVMMPKLDGYQLSKHIRGDEKTSHIPIVMLTARADLDDKIEGLDSGVDSYLIKPFNARELKARIRNLIQQRRDLRERFREATIIKPSEVSVTPVDQAFLENVISTIEENFSEDNFNVEVLADSVHMSVSQINRKLGALIAQPAGQLIRSMRLQRAADLLKQNAGAVTEICFQVGFIDQANFTRAFKKQFGVTPGEYKKQF